MHLRVDIGSTLGVGTCFTIHGLKPTHATPPRPVLNAAAGGQSLDGVRVAVVDDDAETLAAAGELLRSWGCYVDTHLEPPADFGACDLLLVDYQLGGELTGADVIRAHAELRSVIISGAVTEEINAEAQALSVPLLIKPARPAQLRSLLLSTLASRS